MVDLKTLDEDALYGIWSDCLENKWPDIVGKKPENFDRLPNERKWYQIFIKRTKQDYLHLIGTAARALISKEYFDAKMKSELEKFNDEIYSNHDGAGKILSICYGVVPCIKQRESEAIIEYCLKYPG